MNVDKKEALTRERKLKQYGSANRNLMSFVRGGMTACLLKNEPASYYQLRG